MATRAERREHHEADQQQSPHGKIVYRAIYREGADELAREWKALAWSGFAAGLSMGFSLLAEAFLRAHLPDTEWRPLVSKLGYRVGFLIVILGRQQLFTENTLTVILPLLRIKRGGMVKNVGRRDHINRPRVPDAGAAVHRRPRRVRRFGEGQQRRRRRPGGRAGPRPVHRGHGAARALKKGTTAFSCEKSGCPLFREKRGCPLFAPTPGILTTRLVGYRLP